MKVSIIVPIYQVEDYIKETCLSIARQSFKDFEVILVNDGTKDNSVNIAKEVFEQNNTIYRIINKENTGVSSARNEGLKVANGEYVIFVDSDDILSPNILERLVKSSKDIFDFSFCNYQFIKSQQDNVLCDDGNTIVYEKKVLIKKFLKRNINFLLTTMLIKKEFLTKNKIFFDETIDFSEDQRFMWEVILASDQSVYIDENLYGYYLRPKSTMTSSSYNKIYNGYVKYSMFCNQLSDSKLGKMILSRWKLGAIYTSSKLLEYEDFIKIYREMRMRKILFSIIGLLEIKSIILSLVCIFPKLTYNVCRRM